MPDILWPGSAGKLVKPDATGLTFLPAGFSCMIPLQEKCHDGDNDEYYDKPPRDFHGKTCYSPCTQDIGNQRQYKKNHRKID
jgi:hypothetical protein